MSTTTASAGTASKTTVQPYLWSFNGRCEEALNFYRDVLGAEIVMLMRFKDAPCPPDPEAVPPEWVDKVMHANLRIGESTIFASDGRCGDQNAGFNGFSLSLTVKTDAEARRLFDALADGGQVTMPMDKTFFASSFGMVVDRFGVTWMVIVEA